MAEVPMDEDVVIETATGAVRGSKERTRHGSEFFYFHRIPYAKPPLGILRFLPPRPVENWTGILDGTQSAMVESQTNRELEYYWGSEDCLYLNIRTKTINPDKKLPVMVWIGGIAYSCDVSANMCSGYLTDEDVLFIQVSYRIGVFGFLAVGEPCAPGNCGLKDVVQALRWINTNISAFGGDPDNVTLFGSSSAAAMIHFMMLSNLPTGLYHKCIIQSGTTFHNWAVTRTPTMATKHFARHLGIMDDDIWDIIDKLRDLPEEEIIKAYRDISLEKGLKHGFGLYSLFRPCIEFDFEGQTPFITNNPYTIIKMGIYNRVPCIIGCNQMEGLIFQKNMTNQSYESYYKNVRELVPAELGMPFGFERGNDSVGYRLLQFYVPDNTVNEDTVDCYFQFMSDYHFLYYTNKTVRMQSRYSDKCPTYYYVFDHNGKWGFKDEDKMMNHPAHLGEIPYLFEMKNKNLTVNRDTSYTRKRLIRLWTNFAKFSNPTPNEGDELLQVKWDPVLNQNKLNFLYITSELTTGVNPFFDRMEFWEKLMCETTLVRLFKYIENLQNPTL